MKALIVVDVQVDFCPGGNLPVEGGDEVAKNIYRDWLYLRDQYDYIVATKDWHPAKLPGHFAKDGGDWPSHCVAGSSGAELKSPLTEAMFDAVFEKGQNSAAYSGFEGVERDTEYHSSFYVRSLDHWFKKRNVTDVDVCGLATDYCVRATAFDAWQLGYNTGVRTDYTAAVANQEGALRDLRALGIFTD